MKNTRQFDVLVVYNKLATSASLMKKGNTMPFSEKKEMKQLNEAYSYFLDTCGKNGISAALTTTSDFLEDGISQSYWEYSGKTWSKTTGKCYSKLIFDKFSPFGTFSHHIKSLFSIKSGVRPFNDSVLHELFDDKYKTFEKLSKYTIPTVQIDNHSLIGIKSSIDKLKTLTSLHKNSSDFSTSLILKDRFGSGGDNIFKIDSNFTKQILSTINKLHKNSFILQPFMDFETGYNYKKNAAATDIRVIYLNGKIIQSYIRIAKEDDFRCNEHQGGTVLYLKEKEIPALIIKTGKKIIKQLDRKNALYTLDFIISNNGNAYLLEGNINPGIYWGDGEVDDERMTKQLTQIIVKECKAKIARRKLEINIEIPSVLSKINPVFSAPTF